VLWGAFYGVFVVAAAIHGPIGLRTVIREMTPWQGRALDLAMAVLALLLLGLGLRAVVAVVLP
jgi:fumarate reductase subunit C